MVLAMSLFRNILSKRGASLFETCKSINKSRYLFSAKLNLSTKQVEEENKMDHFKSNPYFSKYEAKLKNVYEQNPEVFEKVTGIKTSPKKSDITAGSKMAHSLTKKRELDSIMKINMLEGHGIDDVKKIWTTYLNEAKRLADTLNKEDYAFLMNRSEKFKTFLLPLPRANSGYEFIVCQWSNNECHFTPLINFQAYGENAPSAMTLVYFDELTRASTLDCSKDLDLVLAMVEWDDKMLNRDEAKILLELTKLFYLNRDESDEKYNLMVRFSEKPDEFKHMELIKLYEDEKKKGFGELD